MYIFTYFLFTSYSLWRRQKTLRGSRWCDTDREPSRGPLLRTEFYSDLFILLFYFIFFFFFQKNNLLGIIVLLKSILNVSFFLWNAFKKCNRSSNKQLFFPSFFFSPNFLLTLKDKILFKLFFFLLIYIDFNIPGSERD